MKKFHLFAVTLLFLTPALAHADRNCRNDYNPHFRGQNAYHYRNNNYYHQGSGLRNGIYTGQLSRREVADLRDKKRAIQQEAWLYRSDGRFSKGEREDLRRDIADYREDLHHELNDGERRFSRW